MNQLINDIITDLKNKYTEEGIEDWWNTKDELTRILKSQFKVARQAIEVRDMRPVNLIYLGKIKPTDWFKWNKDKYNIITAKEKNARYKKYIERLEKQNIEQGDTSRSIEQITNM